MEWKQVIKINYPQLFFVFAAFFLMVLVSYISISAIVQRRLSQSVDEVMLTAEANIRAGLSEAEASMNHVGRTVRAMLDGGASQKEVLDYLTDTNRRMQRNDTWLFGFHGIYGYLRDEFIDSIGLEPGPEFIPQTRPWFDAAVRNTGETSVHTEPYVDALTGDIILTAVRNIHGASGEYYGILAIDMDTAWFRNYARSPRVGNGSYYIVLNQYMAMVGHPGDEVIGRQLHDICDGYREIYDRLMTRREISSLRIEDRDGSSAIVSFKRMYNGWYVGVVTPSGIYYQDVYDTAAILSLLGFILMSILSYILLRLSAAKMRSDEENRSKSSFLARMSHEIRTPMNAILGLSELAQREYGKPKALEYITGIRSAGAGLLTIINDILDFSRIEAGNLPLHPAPYQTASLLNDVLTILRMRMSEKSLKLIVAVSPELPGSLLGDAGRGKQILLNLLSNAVKYTDEGFIRFSASGEAEGEDSIRLTFTVEDSGIGIKKEDLPKLFGEFTRIDEKRNSAIEGTGLGLIIARSLCQAMGGDITVTSEYGKGSVFTATLTQRVADRKPMGDMTRVMARREQPHSASFTAPEAEVLIVDDFTSNLLVAEGLLIPYKMRVFTCLNGREAVERVRERSFDLVFMDHMMPEMDGVEATRVIRAMKEERCRTLPIIALTANAVSGMREMFLENGFNDFLSKPIEVTKLDTVLEKWIPAGKRRDAP
ncbi:MAG: response regulator, partial [Candidatus Accumulibacter sp.]|nr:response regulator [Accumulibacter sp.]